MASDATLFVDVRVPGPSADAPRFDGRFEIASGICVLFGPSGSGKSTCLSAIAGLVAPSRGTIRCGDEVLTDVERKLLVPPHRRRVAMVFQSLALFPHMSALENVAYGVPRSYSKAERFDKAHLWLQRMKVKQLDQRDVRTLSGGEAQRVALSRALASEPRVLLLDEPFSALEAALRKTLGSELQKIVADLAIPTLFVTHDESEADALGERKITLEKGRIVLDEGLQ